MREPARSFCFALKACHHFGLASEFWVQQLHRITLVRQPRVFSFINPAHAAFTNGTHDFVSASERLTHDFVLQIRSVFEFTRIVRTHLEADRKSSQARGTLLGTGIVADVEL